jgi:hypothetical protein
MDTNVWLLFYRGEKFMNKNINQVVRNIILAGTLTLGIGTTSVLANNPEVTTQTESTASSTSTADSQTTKDNPSLLPGDFFYFVKTIIEKIEYALTFNDVDKAHRLAEFAQERIKEANVLLAQGKSELAVEALQKALQNQDLALDFQAEEEANTPSSDVAGEDEHTPESAASVNKEVSGQFTQNLNALVMALEKVDNPKAQEALTKNIQKSFERLSKATKKLNEANEKHVEKTTEIETKVKSGQISSEEADREKLKLQEELDHKEKKINEKLEKKISKIEAEAKKQAHEERKKDKEQEKEKRKNEQDLKKAEHKENNK